MKKSVIATLMVTAAGAAAVMYFKKKKSAAAETPEPGYLYDENRDGSMAMLQLQLREAQEKGDLKTYNSILHKIQTLKSAEG